MLKHICIVFFMLLAVVFECHAAGRRSMRASFESRHVRTQQVVGNNFAPAQSADEVAVLDERLDVIVSDDMIDEFTIEQPASESNNSEPLLTDAELAEVISQLNGIIVGLNSEIDALNSEIVRCQKEKKTNTILTVVGGAGVLGTGIGAIVQGKKLHDAKKAGAVEKQDAQDKKEASE